MTFDPFGAAIKDLSVTKLESLQKEIDASLVDLQQNRDAVAQEIAKRRGTGRGPRSRSSNSKSGRQPGKREAVKQIVATKPAGPWYPSAVQLRLNAQGFPSSRESVRVLMRRMVSDEDGIARHPSGEGFIALASSNGSGQESLTEAQS